MIIQWILFICLWLLGIYFRLYFLFRASNYYNDKSLNIKRICAIFYYIFVLGYGVYMIPVLGNNYDPRQGKLLLVFLECLLIFYLFANLFCLISLIEQR